MLKGERGKDFRCYYMRLFKDFGILSYFSLSSARFSEFMARLKAEDVVQVSSLSVKGFQYRVYVLGFRASLGFKI